MSREVLCRRYRCTACSAVCCVVPPGVLPRRRYSAFAIAAALMLWAVDGHSAAAVRRQISPDRYIGATAASGWASLRRWAASPPWPAVLGARGPTWRETARRIVARLLGHAPGSANEETAAARLLAAVERVP